MVSAFNTSKKWISSTVAALCTGGWQILGLVVVNGMRPQQVHAPATHALRFCAFSLKRLLTFFCQTCQKVNFEHARNTLKADRIDLKRSADIYNEFVFKS